MPAQLEDPSSPLLRRRSGRPPYPPTTSQPLPASIRPTQLTLRDGTAATLLPFTFPAQVPTPLLTRTRNIFNQIIVDGDTYPMLDPFSAADFGPYWFGSFAAVLVSGTVAEVERLVACGRGVNGEDGDVGEAGWEGRCLGSFYVKPNYPGRSSHCCNAGFVVGEEARGKGVGMRMGEMYLEWARELGYIYSVFNLVYETNVASCRIWDSLGFDRIGRVPACGSLKSFPGRLIDSIIYGKELVPMTDVDTRVDL